MTPYADFTYFGIALYPTIVALLHGLVGARDRRWLLLVATVGMALAQFWSPVASGGGAGVSEAWLVGGYVLGQWAVARGLLWARHRVRRPWLGWAAVVLALTPLAAAKLLPGPSAGPLAFLGLSYVTFRSLDVLLGIQDRLITALPLGPFLTYLLFFPTLSAGPIDRYRRFVHDWRQIRTRAEFLQDLDYAVHRIFRGFLYKFILAALVKVYWLDPVTRAAGFWNGVGYMYAYTLYLFFDFAGYSAFAVAFSYLLGVHTPENFDRPFLSGNIREFWNRWHISLSWWLRDHVYMRFVLVATKGEWFRSRHLASHLGLVLAMGAMGLWHGPEWRYILYGLYHGILLVAHDVFARWNRRTGVWKDTPLGRSMAVAVTFHAVALGFLLFSGRLTVVAPAAVP